MNITQAQCDDEKTEEINALIETLVSAEQRLVELTGGEVDSIVGRDGQTFLLGRAQEQMRYQDAIKKTATLNELRVLFDLVPAMIWFKDTKNRFLRVNQRVANATGFRIDEIEGKTAYEIFPKTADQYYEDDLDVIRSGTSKLGIVEKLSGPEGGDLWVQTDKVPVCDIDGNVTGLVAMVQDITERKKAEELLRLLSTAVEQSKESIVITDANLDHPGPKIVFVNPGFSQMTGFSFEEAVGQTPRILQGPRTDASVLSRLRQSLEKGEVFSGEAINYHKNGTEFWLEWQVAPLQDETGKTTHFVAIQRNISERKAIETVLRESEGRFREMLNNVELLAMILDLDGNVTFCNDFLLRTSGWNQADVLGNDWFTKFVAAQDQEKLRKAFHSMNSEPIAPRYETRIVTRTGQARDIIWNSSLLRDMSGNLIGVANIGEDITERKSLQEQLLQSQKMESMGSLAGGIAHDFNNLLTGMIGYTELVQMDLPSDSPAQADLKIILKSALQAAAMTKQLLSFARKDVAEQQVIDINALVVSLEDMVRRLLGVDTRLVTRLSPDLGRVNLDPSQFGQLILNLAVNARDAMPNGGTLMITTRNMVLDEIQETHGNHLQPGAYVALTVSDTGCGMSKEVQTRIFDPFFTTKEKGKGTGLGLSTCYGIVTNSGGQIRVHSEIDIGTTFHIYFARVDEPLSSPAAPLERETQGKGETILVVEDEEVVRNLTEQILVAAGYSVLCAPDGGAALKLVASHPGQINLLLSDVIMPGMTGPELSDVLAKVRPDIKILFMSGFADDAILRERTIERSFAFLQKPFSRTQLAEKVRSVLDKPAELR